MKKIRVILTLGLVIWGCSEKSLKNNTYLKSDSNSFQKAEALMGRGLKRPDILEEFGKPHEISDSAQKFEFWKYVDEKGRQVMSLSFDATSGRLLSVLWVPQDSDVGLDPKKVKSRYSNYDFKLDQTLPSGPDVIPTEKLFKDQIHGMSLLIDEARNEVEAITWFNASESKSRLPTAK